VNALSHSQTTSHAKTSRTYAIQEVYNSAPPINSRVFSDVILSQFSRDC